MFNSSYLHAQLTRENPELISTHNKVAGYITAFFGTFSVGYTSCLAFLASVSLVGYAVTVARTPDLRSTFFYRLILCKSVVEWILSIANVGRTLNNAYITCLKYNPFENTLTDCTFLGAYIAKLWMPFLRATEQVACWCTVFVGVDRVIAIYHPLFHRKVHANHARRISLFLVSFCCFIALHASVPRWQGLLPERMSTNASSDGLWMVRINYRPSTDAWLAVFDTVQTVVQLLLIVVSAILTLRKSKELGGDTPEAKQRQKGVAGVSRTVLWLTGTCLTFQLATSVIDRLHMSLHSRFNPSIEHEAVSAYALKIRINIAKYIMIMLSDLCYVSFAVDFFVAIMLIKSFRRAVFKTLSVPNKVASSGTRNT